MRLTCCCATWQVVGYIEGTIGLVTNLPAEIAGLPADVRCPPRDALCLHACPCCRSHSAAQTALAWPSLCRQGLSSLAHETRRRVVPVSAAADEGGVCACFGVAQIANAADPANQPDPTQLANATYLQESFETLVEGLEHPTAIGGSGAVFSYSPCYVNIAPGGVQVRLAASLKPPPLAPLLGCAPEEVA